MNVYTVVRLARAMRGRSALRLANDLLGLAIKGNIIKRQLGWQPRSDEKRRLFRRRERERIDTRQAETGQHEVEVPIRIVGGQVPYKAHEFDGGDDLWLSEEFTVPPRQTVYAPTGIEIAIPPGYIGFITERSSVGKSSADNPELFPGSEHLWVRNGIIDPGYRGEIKLRLYNFSNRAIRIPKGTRLAQILYIPVAYAHYVFKELPPSSRGRKGLGSSGAN